jgi:acetylornithine deacetylase/succinyl-diaminopimelate desuccinylase-like protein
MSFNRLLSLITTQWETDIIPTLCDYIRIPNQSPNFDPDWERHGHMAEAMALLVRWAKAQPIAGMRVEHLTQAGRTPCLFIDIPATDSAQETTLFYGHMDKQPPMTGWDTNKGPWTPVIENNRLYGRGGADDGYALFAALSAISHLDAQGWVRGRCCILIEASEESHSVDLPYYLARLSSAIGTPDRLICLDSGAGNYDQLWTTTSLRGVLDGELKIKTLESGLHSGISGGIVPTCLTILQQLLSRLVDTNTDQVTHPDFQVEIPQAVCEAATATSALVGAGLIDGLQLAEKTRPISEDIATCLLNRSWRPALSVVGQAGIPPLETGGNVTLPSLAVKLSLRLPPTLDPQHAQNRLQEILEADPPFQATVRYTPFSQAPGWHAPAFPAPLARAIEQSSLCYFNKSAGAIGEGGSIPFIPDLAAQFPHTPCWVTGVLGPKSNAHGPNEFLDIPYVCRLTACLSYVLAAQSPENKPLFSPPNNPPNGHG